MNITTTTQSISIPSYKAMMWIINNNNNFSINILSNKTNSSISRTLDSGYRYKLFPNSNGFVFFYDDNNNIVMCLGDNQDEDVKASTFKLYKTKFNLIFE